MSAARQSTAAGCPAALGDDRERGWRRVGRDDPPAGLRERDRGAAAAAGAVERRPAPSIEATRATPSVYPAAALAQAPPSSSVRNSASSRAKKPAIRAGSTAAAGLTNGAVSFKSTQLAARR